MFLVIFDESWEILKSAVWCAKGGFFPMVPSSSPAEPSYTAVSPGKEICSEYNRAFLICLKAAMLLEWGRWACSERCFFKEALNRKYLIRD